MIAAHLPLPVDPAAYTVQDGAGTVRSAGVRWRWTLAGLDDVPHAAIVALQALGDVLRAAGGAGEDLDALAAGVDDRLTALARQVGPTMPLLQAVGPNDPLVHAVESVDTLLSAAARIVAVERVEPQRGRIDQVSSSGGGVPKAAVEHADIGPSGIIGDRQRTRRHHGRPSQALCLWSTEVIEALAAEGHPIGPGAAGENLTLSGLDWSALRPGVRIRLGADAVAEVTGWAEPCTKIAACFTAGAFGRIDPSRHPGWSRAYAAIVAGGTVAAGDEVRLLP